MDTAYRRISCLRASVLATSLYRTSLNHCYTLDAAAAVAAGETLYNGRLCEL